MKNERLAIAGRTEEINEEVMDLARAVISEHIPSYYNYIFDEGTKRQSHLTQQGEGCRYDWPLTSGSDSGPMGQ